MLEDEESWAALKEDVMDYIQASKAKNKGHRTVKPSIITIVDLLSGGTDVNSVKSSSKGKKALPTRNESMKPALNSTGCLTKTEALKAIEAKHFCQEHQKLCYICTDGSHYQYTLSDLAKWAHLLKDYKAKIDEPPAEINVEDRSAYQMIKQSAAVQQACNVVDGSSSSQMPAWAQQLMVASAMAPMIFNPWAVQMMQGNLQNPIGSVPPSSQIMPGTIPIVQSQVPLTMTQNGNMSQTHCAKQSSVAVISPDITTWLVSIDEYPIRGHQQLNYSQYAEQLQHNGIQELSDIVLLSVDDLQQFVEMTYGDAS
ncbi:hypothetical protein J3A83DRAFT_4368980 [Scleroderma citrinum]